tara:strand:- start:1522 stop:2199 length:678 start_codon:yes stop_codon:yes gene_type:complete
MKLASIGPLTETFVEKVKEDEEELEESKESEEELEEAGMAYDREDDVELEGELEGDVEGLEGEELPGEEVEEPGEGDLGGALTDMMQGIADVVERVAEEHGVDLALDVEGGEEELEGELEGEMEEVPPEGLETGEEVEELEEEPSAGARRYTAMGGGAPLEESEEEEKEATEELNEDDLLERITQRVAARLTQEQKKVKASKLKENKINNLTDKIVERIFASTKK